MAKKKTATPKKTTRGKTVTRSGSFNLSAAIRDLVQSHPQWSAKEVIEQIQKDNPKASINVGTAGVTWSNERKKLGLSKKRSKATKGTKRMRAGTEVGNGFAGKAALSNAVEIIKAAKTLIQQCGSTRAAKELLDQF